MSLKDLKLKTNIVKRIQKEKIYYEKESITQQARIDKLKSNGADDADISKQTEVLQETLDMLPDVSNRLQKSITDLQELFSSVKDEFYTSEEYLAAAQVLDY